MSVREVIYENGTLSIADEAQDGKNQSPKTQIHKITQARLAHAGNCQRTLEMLIGETQFYMDKEARRFPLLQVKTDGVWKWVDLEDGNVYDEKPDWYPVANKPILPEIENKIKEIVGLVRKGI